MSSAELEADAVELGKEAPQKPEDVAEDKTTAEPEVKPPTEEKPEEQEDDEEEPEDGVPRVLVTGASGYIASQVAKALLEDGRFRVRGSVRSTKKKEKIQPLLDLVPDSKYPLRLVEADLQNKESWNKAVKSCSYVFHLASPFIVGQVTEELFIRPAVDGTINVLQACANAKTVKRVILTSSIAAISCGSGGSPDKPEDHLYTEADWSLESACAPYEKSKLLAERAAWEFVNRLEEDEKFELTVLNPGYVQGPFNSRSSGGASKTLCLNLLAAKIPGIIDIHVPIIDVRDVVSAHIAALEKSETVGNRYALVAETVSMRQVAGIITAEFKPQGYKIPSSSIPKIGLWIAKLFDNTAKSMYPLLGKRVRYNNEKMVGELGITPRSMKDTIIDTCYSLIELGEVRKAPGYLGHPSTRPTPPPKEELAVAEAGDNEPAAAETELEPIVEAPRSEQEGQTPKPEPESELEPVSKAPESEPEQESKDSKEPEPEQVSKEVPGLEPRTVQETAEEKEADPEES